MVPWAGCRTVLAQAGIPTHVGAFFNRSWIPPARKADPGRRLGRPPMIAGLPLDAWILLVTAVGLGLTLELAFYRARRRGRERKRP